MKKASVLPKTKNLKLMRIKSKLVNKDQDFQNLKLNLTVLRLLDNLHPNELKNIKKFCYSDIVNVIFKNGKKEK